MDIVKIASETIEGLFNMRLALPVALVRALTEGLDEVLRKCALLHASHPDTLHTHALQGCIRQAALERQDSSCMELSSSQAGKCQVSRIVMTLTLSCCVAGG